MSLQLNLEVSEIQIILAGLAKLPLESSLETWAKVKSQAEQLLALRQPVAQPAAEPEPPAAADCAAA